jgi:hypothetical protein
MVVLNEIVLVFPTEDPGVDEALYPFPPPVSIKDDRRYQGQWCFDIADTPKRNQPAAPSFFPKDLNSVGRIVNWLPFRRVA